jgi:hypothetical protein
MDESRGNIGERGNYGTEDVDPRESLEELRGYEGVVEGSTWSRVGGEAEGSGSGSRERQRRVEGEGSQPLLRRVGSRRNLIDSQESCKSPEVTVYIICLTLL